MFSYNRATLDELHPSFFSEKWLSVLARSTFLVETTLLRIITGCVCVNCEGLGIKFKSYASSCLIFNAYIPRVACSYHKEMTSHEWNWVLLVELKNLIYWISNCRKRLFCWKNVFLNIDIPSCWIGSVDFALPLKFRAVPYFVKIQSSCGKDI